MCFMWEVEDFRLLRVGCGLHVLRGRHLLEFAALATKRK